VYCIAKKTAPISVIVHEPKTNEGKQKLSKCVSDVHANLVVQFINSLNCPFEQKIQLFDAVIQAASRK
jgi:hypothetical protein